MVNNIYNLSFILSTRNRLPFLRITLEKLLLEVLPDEEIVVLDGNSTDGTKEYLQGLYEAGKIHQFISEPDKNQAHGWNKTMLLAKGILIKKIIDDDVFCYPAIRECKNYMLVNSQIDVCISNDLGSNISNPTNIEKYSRYAYYTRWNKKEIPSFTFGDVHLLLRRTSLAYIGLYNTDFVMMDWEYSLRISYLKANITYYTGYNALSVFHPGTVSANKNTIDLEREGEVGKLLYRYKGDGADIPLWSRIKIFIGKLVLPAKKEATTNEENKPKTDIGVSYALFYEYIDNLHNSAEGEFC